MTTIGRYEVVRELGRGGMGVVCEVRDPAAPERRLAAKQLLARSCAPGQLLRFQREAELLARVRHPGVVVVHELGSTPAGPLIITDLVPGRTLRALRGRDGLAPVVAARLVRDVADAVAALHAQGVLHRDLKGDNVMVRDDGRPVLLDFGLARELDDVQRLTETGTILGTPSHMAPEQADGASSATFGPPVDVYGLGGILYEALLGRAPFEGQALAHLLVQILKEPPRWPSELRPGAVPWALEAVLRTCLAKDPADRYPTAAALRDDLTRFLAGQPTEALRSFPAPRSRARLAAALAAGVFVVAITLLVVARDPPAVATATTPPAPRPPAPTIQERPPAVAPALPFELAQTLRVSETVPITPVRCPTYSCFLGPTTLLAWTDMSHQAGDRLVRLPLGGEASAPADLRVLDVAREGERIHALTGELILTLDATTLAVLESRPETARRIEALASGRRALLRDGEVRLVGPGGEDRRIAPDEPGSSPVALVARAGRLVLVRRGPREDASHVGDVLQVWGEPWDAPPRRVALGFPANSAGLAPDGRLLAIGHTSGTIGIYDLDAPEPSPRWLDGGVHDDPALELAGVAQAHARLGGAATIFGVAFTPDGRRLVSLLSDFKEEGPAREELALWDVQRGEPLHLARTALPPSVASDLAMSPDGVHVAVGDALGGVRVLRVGAADLRDERPRAPAAPAATFELVQTLQVCPAPEVRVEARSAFLDGATLLAWTRSKDGGPEVLARFTIDGRDGPPSAVRAARIDALAMASGRAQVLEDGLLHGLDPITLIGQGARPLRGELLVALADGRVAVTHEGALGLVSPDGAVVSLAPDELGCWPIALFTAAGRLVLVRRAPHDSITLAGDALQVWDRPGATPVRRTSLLYPVRSAALAPDGRLLALGYAGGAIALHDLDAPDAEPRWLDGQHDPDGGLSVLPQAHARLGAHATIYGLAFTPDGRRLVSLLSDRAADGHPAREELALWDVAGRSRLRLARTADPTAVAFDLVMAPDGRKVAVGDVAGRVRVFGLAP